MVIFFLPFFVPPSPHRPVLDAGSLIGKNQLFASKMATFADFGTYEVEISEVLPIEISVLLGVYFI